MLLFAESKIDVSAEYKVPNAVPNKSRYIEEIDSFFRESVLIMIPDKSAPKKAPAFNTESR